MLFSRQTCCTLLPFFSTSPRMRRISWTLWYFFRIESSLPLLSHFGWLFFQGIIQIHGGVPSQDEAHPETSLRVSKLRELPFKSAGGMWRVSVMNNLFKIPLPTDFGVDPNIPITTGTKNPCKNILQGFNGKKWSG